MPKFEKGSPEAIEHMRILRERRKNKPLTELQISRNNKKLEVQGILNPINVMIPLRGYHNIERCMGDGG